MIRLKHLLFEQPEANSSRILFVGDKQTLAKNSYASNLINTKAVTGVIAGTTKATAADLYKSLQRKLDDSYAAVVLMIGPDQVVDTSTKTITNSVRVLNACIRLAKLRNVKIIVIISPLTKVKTKLSSRDIDTVITSIESNTDADDVISINIEPKDLNKKTGLLNSGIQQEIQNAVVESINELLQINISSPGVTGDEEDVDGEQPSDDESDIPSYSELAKIPANASEFIQQWKDTAISHMKKHGIPASITLAQGALESGWGRSYLARKGNNYFGIKCHSWSGEKIYADDDHPNECFRKYKDAAESFEDHANFLMNNSRYDSLFKLPATDYRAWAKGLKAAGYATSATYAEKLVQVIEQYGLSKFDGGDGTASKSIKTAASNFDTDAEMKKILSLPFSYQDISSASTYGRKDEPLPQDKYFIIHHTAGHGTAMGVVRVLNKRGLGVQWVVDREGKIYQTLPRGARGAHILNSALGPNNSNSQGVEVIAKNDADILPIQAAAVHKLIKALGYNPSQLYGHGEVNPGHKAASEGQTIKQYIEKNWDPLSV